MVKLLFVKLSSLGDVIHSLPAIHDIAQNRPDIELHWLVEQSLAPLASLNSFTQKTLPINLRSIKKQHGFFAAFRHMQDVCRHLKTENYDMAIDAQGLWKSAYFARGSGGDSVGYDFSSARDPFASLLYQKKITIKQDQHAIIRMRKLCAQALDYSISPTINYGLDKHNFQQEGQKLLKQFQIQKNFIFGFHGTTWETKLWKQKYWGELASKLQNEGFQLVMSYGNEAEKQAAFEMTDLSVNIKIIPKMDYLSLINLLSAARGFVSVDTGLGHLASALDIPGVGLYGPTSPDRVGLLGKNQRSLTGYAHKPRYNKKFIHGYDAMNNITSDQVLQSLLEMINAH